MNGQFGYDTLHFGVAPGLPSIEHQLIVGLVSKSLYVASLGIHPVATNLTDYEHPIPSLLTTLKQQQLVSSLSWAYSAGSFFEYQGTIPISVVNAYLCAAVNKQSLASLLFGGYDSSLFQPSNVNFNFSEDPPRDLSA